MTFSLANATGWTTGDLLTETQINQLDAEHAAAIDGSGGGTYTLTAPLTINGDTVTIGLLSTPAMTVTTLLATNAQLTDLLVGNDTILGLTSSDTITTNGVLTCEASVFANDNVTLGSAPSDSLLVYSSSDFVSPAVFEDTVGFQSDVNFDAGVTLGNSSSDSITVPGIIQFSGTGRARETGTAPNIAGATVSFDSFRNILILSTATTPTTFTITGTDANGEWFILQNDSAAAHTIASSLFTGFSLPANSGVKMMRFSGVWFTVQRWT